MRRTIRLLTVGRPRAGHWKDAAAYYLDRLGHWFDMRETIIADAPAGASPTRRSADECARLLAAVEARNLLISLDERGTSLTSRRFAALLRDMGEDATKIPCFAIGGPYGLNAAVRRQSRFVLSFGPMTLPHELARILLLEQLYRAGSIERNLPYHHEG